MTIKSESESASPVSEAVESALREVIDPELGINIVDLGLVYGVDVDPNGVCVRLTMTTPACPLGEHIVRDAEERLVALSELGSIRVELVWDPPWDPSRMSEEAKRMLGWG
ncbi:MAG: metal-sulfur cluster assembly factor [Deltaproteobacteria bacterium]|nr:metal-sulfur cluster assembly factor [Deltaproteobacteria bacterium]